MAAMRLLERHVELLGQIAACRLVTSSLVAHLAGLASMQSARRLMQRLEKEELVNSWERQSGNRGRPEKLLSLAAKGRELLMERGKLPEVVPFDTVDGRRIHCPDHQLLLNWFTLHLGNIEQARPDIHTGFLIPDSPVCRFGHSAEIVALQREAGFIPDAAFRIASEQHERSLLFFLEVDMGTEPKFSRGRQHKHITEMIHNYQHFLASGGYRFWQSQWQTAFRGFRLLILANSGARAAQLLTLTSQMQPTNFIWITDERQLAESGLAAPIWSVGDGSYGQHQSILGKGLSCTSPLRHINP